MEEKKSKIESVDFKAAEAAIASEIGVPVHFEIEVNEKGVRIKSKEDFKDHCGVMSSIYEEVRICNFGGGFLEDTRYFRFPVHWQFSYKAGGSNGTGLIELIWDSKERCWFKR
jgi:hypothetical protein